MRTIEEIKEIIDKIIIQHVGEGPAFTIYSSDPLSIIVNHYELDSLDQVEIMMELEAELCINIDSDKVNPSTSYDAFIQYLHDLQSNPNSVLIGRESFNKLELVTKPIDWDQVLINATISASQGLQESGKLGEVLELSPDIIAERSIAIGQALVKKLKECINQVP